MASQFTKGQAVDVLIFQPETRESVWESDSKPYRVSVNDGQRFYADAAPECVRAAQGEAAEGVILGQLHGEHNTFACDLHLTPEHADAIACALLEGSERARGAA